MVYGLENLFYQWELLGVFDIGLPFLLIFALVFGLLTTTNIFSGNRGVNLIVALSIGALSLRSTMVSEFFSVIFPRMGVGLAILFVIVILSALFIPAEDRRGWLIGFGVLGLLIAVITVINSFSNLSWFFSDWWGYDLTMVITVVIGIGIIVALALMGPNKESKSKSTTGLLPLYRVSE
jgi:hypothetical protein